MDHLEIRAVRGALSRVAFARLLGVTSLTVLRWELPEDNKEARRPRAKMVEALRKLASEGVGSVATAPGADDEEEDVDASEPVPSSLPPPRSSPPPAKAEVTDDERLLAPLLEQLMGESWRAAEDELLRVASGGGLTTSEGRALAALGLIQVQLLGRLDVRGGLTALMPLVDAAERGSFGRAVTGRIYLLAALFFGAPDCRFFDVGRVNAYAAKADALLDADDADARVILTTARLAAARFLGPHLVTQSYQAGLSSLNRAISPLARALAGGLHSMAASHRGDQIAAVRHGGEGLGIIESLGLWPLLVAMLSDRAWRAVLGPTLPDDILKVTRYALARADEADVAPVEPLIRLLGCEIDALIRAARFDEANAAFERAQALAKRGGLPRVALAMPVTRLLLYTNRVDQLEDWAKALEAETAGSTRPFSNIHALAVRGSFASLNGDYERADELLSQVCAAPETTPGIDYVAHDALFELILVKLLRKDQAAAEAALKRAHAYNAEHPSVWHGAIFSRMEAFVYLCTGRFAEARKKMETTMATYALIGDVVQVAFAKGGVAMIGRAAGAPDAEQQLQVVLQELQVLGVWSPQLLRRAQALSAPPPKEAWRAETVTERLVGAVDRLSVRGLSSDQYRRGLAVILGELFPGRQTLVGGQELEELDAALLEVPDGDGVLRFGVRGSVEPEELAALRVLSAFLPRALGSTVANEPQIAIDAVLPHFIAAAAATRKLKGEIARLSRSSATVLIGGESGSGKEVVARAVHDLSARAGQPYVVFNCASVPRDLFESQLFGHRKGAFTGALADSPGVIRAADSGTLFLDEVGELPLDTQPKLLRFLENSEVFPLGEQRPRRVDVRVLAATHRDLDQLVREGRFREDLYYRLNVIPLSVPPLRERKEDIVALARVFLARLTPDGSSAPDLGADAVHALKAHGWPGNVRELRNVIERAMAYAPIPPVLHARHLRIASA